ncbi:MAG: glycosyltransferase family 1 protein [Protaetiibacter sp.]
MTAAQLEVALRSRLLEAAPLLLPGCVPAELGSLSTIELVRIVLRSLRERDRASAWLGYVALAGAFPTLPQLDDFARALRLASDATLVAEVLEAVDIAERRHRTADRTIRIVRDSIIVDVGFCATHAHNTGIQRVVRSLIPRWEQSGHPHLLVAWTHDDAGYRDLTEVERRRVTDWRQDSPRPIGTEATPDELIVPWECGLFLPEVPQYDQCGPLAALADAAVATIDLIGYDVIPITSADSVSAGESERFAIFLDVVKRARSVIAISDTVRGEFDGFASTLSSQGIAGPAVHSVPLAVDVPPGAREIAASETGTRVPTVLCVGSHEPRKNQEAVLFAAQRLHREGVPIRMVFVGGGNRVAYADFDRRVRALRRTGMQVESHRRLSDAELWRLYGESRFSVFVSLHEGFGLPVAESLALGTPTLTSDRGSLAEIAALGGCVTVDPRDDEAIVNGMRALLSDDELRDRLAGEAARIASRSWLDYAERVWELVAARGVA